MSKKDGFTLAEVLITLSVIGIIAALTIPAIMNATQLAKYKASVKKATSILNQAMTIAIAQNGTDTSSISNSSDLSNFFMRGLNIRDHNQSGSLSNGPLQGTVSNFTTADGIGYAFVYGGSNGCPSTDPTNVGSAYGCYVQVTVPASTCGNYDPLPGQLSSGGINGAANLQCSGYYFAITQSQVVPVSNNTYDAVNFLLSN